MNNQININEPLLTFLGKEGDTNWTYKHSFSGCAIFGSTGSGKSSGSARLIAKKFLQHGYGGLVLTVKEDEVEQWRTYCREEGKSDQLIVIEPSGNYYFNFLEYISSSDDDSNYAQNIFKTLKEVIKANEQRESAKGDDMFWQSANDIFIKSIIQLSLLAYGKVTSMQLLYDLAQTAPKKVDHRTEAGESAFSLAFEAAKKKVLDLTEVWTAKQSPEWLDSASQIDYEQAVESAIPEMRTLKMLKQFFFGSLFSLGDKTRAIIDFYFTGFLHSLLEDPIYSLFCQNPSNITPEHCLEGKIIVINLPTKKYDKAGQYAQLLFKYIWQKAIERRNINENNRPVFLYQDEGQAFVLEYDNLFQATARSSMVATVLITQSLANLHDAMGGDKAEYKVKSLLGNLGTKIFHSNADTETNDYASKLIGKAWMEDPSRGTSIGKEVSLSTGSKYMLQDMVRPEHFAMLKNGGSENKLHVEAYVHLQNTAFPNGFNHQKVTFIQNSK